MKSNSHVAMKKIALLLFAISFLLPAFAQTRTSLLLEPFRKKYPLYIELEKDSGIVYQLAYFIDKAGTGFQLQEIDTFYRTDSLADTYRGSKSSFEIVDQKAYFDMPGYKPFKGKKTRMHGYQRGQDEVYQKIKNGYWWRQFLKLTDEINAMFPWQHFSFRNGFGYWELLNIKHYPYSNFVNEVDKRIAFLRDSLIAAESAHTRIAKGITENVTTIEYAALKEGLIALPEPSYMHGYFRIIVNEIALHRPEFFFRLMDDMPSLHAQFILLVDRKKETMQKLRSVETDSPSKRDFFKKSY